jgi:heme-degrading monooxygenase HmoA
VNIENHDYFVLWEFQVKPEAQRRFETIYGREGDWSLLFRQSPHYLGTQLFQDVERPGRYLTLDRWRSGEALHRFKTDHKADYDAFDKQCESLTRHESLIGEFEGLPA